MTTPLFFESSNRESKGLSAYKLEFSYVFRVFDVEGCACDLFVRGPGNQQHPEEAPSCGERWSGDKVGVSLYPVSPLGSSSSLRGARRHRTLSILRVGGLVVPNGGSIARIAGPMGSVTGGPKRFKAGFRG